MADDDPSSATTPDRTQPLPATGEQPPEPPGRAGGWRWNQVAVVAVLTLLLGAAGGALLVFLGDDDSPEDPELAGAPTSTTSTTTSTSTSAEGEAAPSTPGTTPGQEEPAATTTTVAGGLGGTGPDTGGETAVGNSIFTGTYQSSADRSTGEFTVDRNWQIRWDVPVGEVTLEVYDGSGGLVEVIDARGVGQRRFPEPGTYRVEIETDGSRYTVVITDGP